MSIVPYRDEFRSDFEHPSLEKLVQKVNALGQANLGGVAAAPFDKLRAQSETEG